MYRRGALKERISKMKRTTTGDDDNDDDVAAAATAIDKTGDEEE